MKKTVFFLLAAAATMVACNKAEVPASVNDEARVVKFNAENLYTFETKAISGDVYVWASDPINAKGTYQASAGELSSSYPLLWGVEQAGKADVYSNFFAMYPIRDGDFVHGSTGYVYNINTTSGDAKTADIEIAENFMVAATKAAPGTGETPAAVSLSFVHPFAKIVYNVTNNSDDAINYATIAGVYWNGSIDYTDSEAPGSLAVAATKSGSVTDGNEANQAFLNGGYDSESGKYIFHTISMPSTGLAPAIKVVMHSGAYYVFNVSSAINVEAGKVYTADITLSSTHSSSTNGRSVSATFTETDWADAANQPALDEGTYSGATTWPSIKGSNISVGEAVSGDFERTFPMKRVGATACSITIKKIDNAQNIAFKVYIDGADTWYGRESNSADAIDSDNGWKYFTGHTPGENILWGDHTGGYITIYYYTDTHSIFVKPGNNQTR